MNKTTIDSNEQGIRIGKSLGDSIAEGITKPETGVEKELGLQKALEKVAGSSLRVGESSTTDNLNERIREALSGKISPRPATLPSVPVTDPVNEVVLPQGTTDKSKNEQVEVFKRLRGMGFSVAEALAEVDGK